MAEPLRWPNVERATIAWLRAWLPDMWVVSELPANDPPRECVTVERVGGGSGGISKDVDVEIAVHAADRARMWDLVGAVEGAMHALAANGDPRGDPPFYVDDVDETFAFRNDPHPNQTVRRALATYTLTVRPIRAHVVTASRP